MSGIKAHNEDDTEKLGEDLALMAKVGERGQEEESNDEDDHHPMPQNYDINLLGRKFCNTLLTADNLYSLYLSSNGNMEFRAASFAASRRPQELQQHGFKQRQFTT